eukprot:1162079-Pelagomonas_calceolata.AAC.5
MKEGCPKSPGDSPLQSYKTESANMNLESFWKHPILTGGLLCFCNLRIAGSTRLQDLATSTNVCTLELEMLYNALLRSNSTTLSKVLQADVEMSSLSR